MMNASAPRRAAALDELERLGHLVILNDDVHGDVHAGAGEVRRAAGGPEGLVGEVVGLASGVERPHAAIDGIGAGGERGGEGRGAAGGGEQLGTRTWCGICGVSRRVMTCLSNG